MKALSGYAEWFWLMAKNWKDVENRTWPLGKYIKREDLPVRIYLHASLTPVKRGEYEFIIRTLDIPQLQEFRAVNWEGYRGHIIGEITITDCITSEDIGMPSIRSPWFFGPYGFLVRDGVLYDKPIPYKGQLGFFKVNLVLVTGESNSWSKLR